MTDQIKCMVRGLFHNDIMYRGVINVVCGVSTVAEAAKRGFQRIRECWRGSDNGNRWHCLKEILRELLNIGRGVFTAYQGVQELRQTCIV